MRSAHILTVCFVLAVLAGWALGDAQSDFDTLFGDEVKKVTASRNPKAAAELAVQMLKTVGSVENRPDLDMVLWKYAADLGAKDPSGFATATAAIRKLVAAAPGDAGKWTDKLSAIYRRRYSLARGDERLSVGGEQVDDFVAIGDAQSAAGDPSGAMSTYRKALSTANLIRSPRRPEILDKIKAANAATLQRRDLDRMTRALVANPDDVKTRTAIVRMQVLQFDKPSEAVKLLNEDLDEMLRTYVLMAAKKTDQIEPAACLELGRWYWEMYPAARTTPTKTIILGRTKTYLDRFNTQDAAQGADKVRAMLIMKQVDAEMAKLVAKGAAAPGVLTKPLVMYDFETLRMTGWKMTGTAFGKGPCTGRPTPEYPASGFAGKGMISSYHGADPGTGTLTSPKFLIRGKSITFLVGGGPFPSETCMHLMIDGKVARTVVGNKSNTLHQTGWDVSDLVGKTAQLHMIDTATSGWGHILVDHIVQHPGAIETVIKVPTKSKTKSKTKTKKPPSYKKKPPSKSKRKN
jgi:hypothetical protein